MKLRGLIWRGLVFHRRVHVGVLLGTALACAVLVGALAMGDSVRYTLRHLADLRLGRVELAVRTGAAAARAELADDLAGELGTAVAPALMLRGVVSDASGTRRVAGVQVLGVDERFWQLGPGGGEAPPEGVALNRALAAALGARESEPIIVRAERLSPVLRDAALARSDDLVASLRVERWSVRDDEAGFGRFGLAADQQAPVTAFVPLSLLAERIDAAGRANLFLIGAAGGEEAANPAPESVARALAACWKLADVEHELGELAGGDTELRSSRFFLDPALADAAMTLPVSRGVFTYLVDTIRPAGGGERETPYSMVTALEDASALIDGPPLDDEDILVNAWLAEDLKVGPGDRVELEYRRLGAGRDLRAERRTFRVRAVLPLKGAAADPSWTPELPGVSEADHCRDWAPGLPLDLRRIRPEDEEYWEAHRGTPKAFVALAAGRAMWGSAFGDLTAVRFGEADPASLAERLRSRVEPGSVGLGVVPLRARAEAASAAATDFGELFLGYSFFLIITALLLAALLFALGAGRRSAELGTLLAMGFTPRRARRLLFAEGAVVATGGSLLGGAGGLLYAHALVLGLATIWRPASGAGEVVFSASAASVAIGVVSGLISALLALWLSLRSAVRPSIRQLLSGSFAPAEGPRARKRARVAIVIGVLCLADAAFLALFTGGGGHRDAGIYFGAGASLLVAGLLFARAALVSLAAPRPSLAGKRGGLVLRNVARRPGRSLTTIALLASGAFLVAAVSSGQRDARDEAGARSSGTGGFELVAESSLPVLFPLDEDEGQGELGLLAEPLVGIGVVPFRVRDGDDASCLNLNQAQVPRLLGVDARELARRQAFRFLGDVEETRPWMRLAAPDEPGVIPAIGDEPTVYWALHENVGDLIELTDGRGRPVRLRIVGMIAGSVLQGSLIIDEGRFAEHFPNLGGHRFFLIDTPPGRGVAVAGELSEGLADLGMRAEPAVDRLGRFMAVENTYVAIFRILGGLGLLVGCAGVGLVLLRNVLERRAELAAMVALGFTPRRLRGLILREHLVLLAAGLGLGALAALLAAIPALGSWEGGAAAIDVAGTFAALAISGVVWTVLATRLALRGPLLSALREE